MNNEIFKLIAVAVIASVTTIATQHYMSSAQVEISAPGTQLQAGIKELEKVEAKPIIESIKTPFQAPKMESMYEAEAMRRVDVFYVALEEYKNGTMKLQTIVDTTTRPEREKILERLQETFQKNSGLDDYHFQYFFKHVIDYGTTGPTGSTFMNLARKLSAFPDNNYRGYLKTDAYMIAAKHPDVRRIMANKLIVYLNDHPELAQTK